jgi:hypothetical protein
MKWFYDLYHPCKLGSLVWIQYFIDKGANNWDRGLLGACENGDMSIIDLVIAKSCTAMPFATQSCGQDGTIIGMNWDFGFYGACLGGHVEIIELMINLGATNWNLGIQGLCEGAHVQLVKKYINNVVGGNWDLIIRASYEGGCNEIIEIVENYAFNYATNANYALMGACISNKRELINIIENADINYGFYGACKGGHLELVKEMIDKGANDIKNGIIIACEEGHLEIIKFLSNEDEYVVSYKIPMNKKVIHY